MKTLKIKNAKLYIWSNFQNLILDKAPKKLPKAPNYLKHVLEKPMTDAEIQETWAINPYSIGEFLALITELIGKQPNREDGPLLTNGYINIFYVQLKGRVVAASVYWGSLDREWNCDAYGLVDVDWNDGSCVFSRSLTSQNISVSDLDGEIIKIKGVEYKLTKLK